TLPRCLLSRRPLTYAALIAGRHTRPLWTPFNSNSLRDSTRIQIFACRVDYEDSKTEDSSSSHSTPLEDGLRAQRATSSSVNDGMQERGQEGGEAHFPSSKEAVYAPLPRPGIDEEALDFEGGGGILHPHKSKIYPLHPRLARDLQRSCGARTRRKRFVNLKNTTEEVYASRRRGRARPSFSRRRGVMHLTPHPSLLSMK
ncbi:hypothetical protein EV121DRAFT_274923, partial [Schizophyllum commune]